tara:strand:+ start:2514 stop:4073 length:1560 start_codon:yes stop_codon:yes gene_type:complete
MSFVTKPAVKTIAKAFSLKNTTLDNKFFDALWELFQIGNKYKRDHEDEINKSLNANYFHLIAAILGKKRFKFFPDFFPESTITVNNNVFKRIKTFNIKPNRFRIRRNGRNVWATRGPSKFVIFSDHHMTENDHRHSYFKKNKGLYKEALNYYADKNYGLIENGDVEEYTIFEPTVKIINSYNSLIEKDSFLGISEDIGSINWAKLKEKRISNRIEILKKIIHDNNDLYTLIEDRFATKGKRYYTKITGNHDPYESSNLVDLLPVNMAKNLCDALRINYRNSDYEIVKEPKYFITHGHQFDSTTLPQHAHALGEVFSETLGWTIQGADRIWDSQKTDQWRNSNLSSSFRNVLATADKEGSVSNSMIDVIGEAVFESLMHNHEIAWEYFDSSSKTQAVATEVMTGDEYYKVRHLSETKLVEKMDYYSTKTELKNFKKKTKLIIGHTHEPRMKARKRIDRTSQAGNYLNSGSAGRFENLIWGIELVNGQEKIISWTKEGSSIIRNHWEPDNSGKLIKKGYPI